MLRQLTSFGDDVRGRWFFAQPLPAPVAPRGWQPRTGDRTGKLRESQPVYTARSGTSGRVGARVVPATTLEQWPPAVRAAQPNRRESVDANQGKRMTRKQFSMAGASAGLPIRSAITGRSAGRWRGDRHDEPEGIETAALDAGTASPRQAAMTEPPAARDPAPPPVRWVAAFLCIVYGFAKLNGAQFTVLDSELARPMGQVSGFWLTWHYFGYSAVYGTLLALIQIGAAILLVVPRTTLAGAVLLLPVAANILLIDVFYGVDLGGTLAGVVLLGCVLADDRAVHPAPANGGAARHAVGASGPRRARRARVLIAGRRRLHLLGGQLQQPLADTDRRRVDRHRSERSRTAAAVAAGVLRAQPRPHGVSSEEKAALTRSITSKSTRTGACESGSAGSPRGRCSCRASVRSPDLLELSVADDPRRPAVACSEWRLPVATAGDGW